MAYFHAQNEDENLVSALTSHFLVLFSHWGYRSPVYHKFKAVPRTAFDCCSHVMLLQASTIFLF